MNLSRIIIKEYGDKKSWRNRFPKLFKIMHRCNLIKNKMTHFVNNLGAYLMFEVMESAWVNLQDGISSAKSLDDVIKFHDDYLNDIIYSRLPVLLSCKEMYKRRHNKQVLKIIVIKFLILANNLTFIK